MLEKGANERVCTCVLASEYNYMCARVCVCL